MTIDFFVASSWEDRGTAESYANILEKEFGWKCTTDWWNHTSRKKKLQYAVEDLNNLRKSDVLVVYNSKLKSSGKLIEIGIALALDIPVFLYGERLQTVYDELVYYKGKKLSFGDESE